MRASVRSSLILTPLKCAAAGLAMWLASAGANATLVSTDLALPGDGLLTYDSATGLQWLDLTATLGKSVNEVLGGYGGYIDTGFRYATTAEVEQLYLDAGAIGIGKAFPGD